MAAHPLRTQADSSNRAADGGFTVIEALVAMVILAISAVALIGVSEAQITRIDGIETRAIASWVAENRLAELSLGPAARSQDPARVAMLGRQWTVELSYGDTDDADLKKIAIAVREANRDGPSSRLLGFIDARKVGAP